MVQKWQFFQLFFFRQYSPGKCVLWYSRTKPPFKAIKRRNSKSRNIDIFPKGLTHGFCPKMAIFPIFFLLCNTGEENVFYDILERKNAFLGYKNKKFKKSKNWHFSKGVNSWFSSKNGHFFKFFFRQYRPGKRLLWYFRDEKSPSRLQKQQVKNKSKKKHFSKGVNPRFWSKNGHFLPLFF